MADVVTLGECMALLYPEAGVALAQADALRLDIAGAESNLAIALSRLGVRARLIGRVGADPFGQRIRAALAAEGVDVGYLASDAAAATGVFFREHLPDGARRVYYYRAGSAGSRLDAADLSAEMLAGARIVHLTGITPALSPSCAAACARMIELTRAAGALVSFDPNYRAPLWAPDVARAALLPLLWQSDIVLIGHEDAAALFGPGLAPEQVLAQVAALGVRVAVLKRAEQGALALVDGALISAPAEHVTQVVDPVGAGDGFDAGFLAGWLRGWPAERALRLGAQVGAAAVAAAGDYAGYPHIAL